MTALTKEALEERRKGIGGSDAAKIVSGEWHALWLEKTGRVEPDDLSHSWPVQLGIATEKLNLDFYGWRNGKDHWPKRRGEGVVSDEHPILRCTLDGFDEATPAVIQAKHVNGFSKLEEVVARYTPQVMHEMIVTKCPNGFLSIIIGASEPQIVPVEYDEFWAAEYIGLCNEFWRHVTQDIEPTQGKPLELASAVPVEQMRKVDMAGNNEWAALAADWLTHKAAAKTWKDAVEGIKKLVEADMSEASGYGIVARRSKAGAIGIKEAKS